MTSPTVKFGGERLLVAGDKARFVEDRGLVVTVIGVSIYGHNVSYDVVWMHDGQRKCETVKRFEIEALPAEDEPKIGLRGPA